MEFFLEEDIELINDLRRDRDFDVKDLLNKKKLSAFELDLIMNQAL